MSGARKPIIFISYSHLDEPEKPTEANPQWATFVIGFLRSALRETADIWIDRLMPGGADWEAEIARKLGECDVFVLLASHYSLSSDYVTKTEIPTIRERQKKGEKVHFYPILLTPTPKAALNIIQDINLRPRDKKPLSGFPPHEQKQHIADAADEIADIAAKLATTEAPRLIPPILRAAELTSAHKNPDGTGVAIVANMSPAPLDLAGWRLLINAEVDVPLPVQKLAPGEPLPVALPIGALDDRGGLVTLINASGLRVDGEAYRGGDGANGSSTSLG